MKWNRQCSVCNHRNDFDPLVDECPYAQNPVECDRKLLKEIRDGQGLVLVPANVNPAELERKLKKLREIRVLPMPKVTGVYEHEFSKYPDRIRVPMSDGKVVTYTISVEMPHPCFEAAMKNLERMNRV